MFDRRLRPLSQRFLQPASRRLKFVSPDRLTAAAALSGLGAAVAAGQAWWLAAAGLWLGSRVLDGIDGVVARSTGQASDAGGYLDMTLDVVVYAAVPLGVAVGLGSRAAWIAVAVLLAAFYVNTIVWSYLAALLEKRGRAEQATTSIVMPPVLIEGAETIVLFTLILLAPLVSGSAAVAVMVVMAALVAAGAVVRFVQGRRRLLAPPESPR